MKAYMKVSFLIILLSLLVLIFNNNIKAKKNVPKVTKPSPQLSGHYLPGSDRQLLDNNNNNNTEAALQVVPGGAYSTGNHKDGSEDNRASRSLQPQCDNCNVKHASDSKRHDDTNYKADTSKPLEKNQAVD